jgi:23S rRNA (uracil1939-C5)-methyltransferase
MTDAFDLRIDSIAAGGDGVGRHEGMVVFVPRTAPGDLAQVEARRGDRLLRGRLRSLIEPSSLRTEPPCHHYVHDRCGGCQVQHLGYDAQLAAKGGIIRDALVRIGRVPLPEPPAVEKSDKPLRYRRKLTLALRQDGKRWVAGLHRYDAPDEVFALQDCLITDEAVLAVWKDVMAHQQLLPRAAGLRGAVRTLDRGFSFVLEGGRQWREHATLFERVPSLAELWWVPEDQRRRRLHAREISQAGASFAQVNPGVAERLRDFVFDLARPLGAATAVDAYAGTGDIAVGLAAQGTVVTAIEIDRDAARIAQSRLPEGSRAIAGSVEGALTAAMPAELVVLNPPRSGLHPRVPEILEAARPRPRRIVYVSCNPATLARDIRRLPGFRVESVRGFDMFPQTAHVETVCALIPAA